MQHLYPQQHDSSSNNVHHTASEIEVFRARQRMQLRYQQHLQSLHTGNQAEVHFSFAQERAIGNEDDDRVHKMSLTKRRQQLQQRLQQQQQTASNTSQTTKLPNFNVNRRHPQQQLQHQQQLHNQCLCEGDMPSPVPHEAHVMFNAFDFGNSPEAFADQQHHDNNNSDHNGGEEGDQQMQQDDDEEEDEETEKSIWRRRFAADDAHLRRLPKLGQDALWDSPSSVSNNTQFSHHHHQQQQQYQYQ